MFNSGWSCNIIKAGKLKNKERHFSFFLCWLRSNFQTANKFFQLWIFTLAILSSLPVWKMFFVVYFEASSLSVFHRHKRNNWRCRPPLFDFVHHFNAFFVTHLQFYALCQTSLFRFNYTLLTFALTEDVSAPLSLQTGWHTMKGENVRTKAKKIKQNMSWISQYSMALNLIDIVV